MARPESPQSPSADSRLQREIERERNEHTMNLDAKAHLGGDADERHKDARETAFSSKVRR
jgi:hypothetical protein